MPGAANSYSNITMISPPVNCGLVQQFNRVKRVFDAALDTKIAPAPLGWNMKSVPGKKNCKIRYSYTNKNAQSPSSPTSNRNSFSAVVMTKSRLERFIKPI